MAEPFAPYAGIEGAALTGGEGGDVLHKLLMGVLQGTVTLPQRVIDATKATAPGLRREDFTDVPGSAQPGAEMRSAALESAVLPMGGTMFSAPVGALGAGPVLRGAAKKYPTAPRTEWYGDANFQQTGGRMVTMTPDEFLAKGRPMKIDDVARENIDDLKAHMLSGKTLDPLAIYKNGKEDGRHRAIAAKELGLNEVPVLVWDK